MAILDKVGDKTIHNALDQVSEQVVPAGQAAADEVVNRVTQQIVYELAGALERSVGALCLSAGSLPEQIAMALEGLTVEVSPFTIKIIRRPSNPL